MIKIYKNRVKPEITQNWIYLFCFILKNVLILYYQTSFIMEDLIIIGEKKTFSIPTVEFIAETGNCSIIGEAYLEDSISFFQPLYDWLYEYIETVKKPITFILNLSYFNTSASKSIFDMLFILREYVNNGGKVSVKWYYESDDEDMLLEIEDYLNDTGLDIERIPY